MPCDINNPLRKPPRYSDLHVSQTLPKTNKLNKVSCSTSPEHPLYPHPLPEGTGPVSPKYQWLLLFFRVWLLL